MLGGIPASGTMDERQHTGARHHGRRRDHLAARSAPWRVATCKRYGHELRGTLRQENPRKQECAAALTGRDTIANNDVNEAVTNEMTRVAATIKKRNLTTVTDGTYVTMATALRILKNILCWTRRFLKCALGEISYSSFT